MINRFIRRRILQNLFDIGLTSVEREIANESIDDKYAPAIRNGMVIGMLMIPAIVFLDTSVIVSVLIPATMVAGTAWFSVSLANLKKKFEPFGLELTYNLFEAFVGSLVVLFLAAAFSLTQPLWIQTAQNFSEKLTWIPAIAALTGSLGIILILYKIFLGAMKYDVNDAMLTGQNEAAEKFFKKSLSLLHTTAEALRDNKSLQVANYYIGVSFFEIYTHILSLSKVKDTDHIVKMIAASNELIDNPAVLPQATADEIAHKLIGNFLENMSQDDDIQGHKSVIAIKDEFRNLIKTNNDEDQHMIDTRLSVIFEEIATLIDEFGERLFSK